MNFAMTIISLFCFGINSYLAHVNFASNNNLVGTLWAVAAIGWFGSFLAWFRNTVQ